MFWQLRSWDWAAILKARIDWRRLRTHIASAPLVYVSDLSNVGSVFLNRFLLSAMTDLEQTGIFVFFWTLANAVTVLVSNSTLQVRLPHLVEAFRDHGNQVFLGDLKGLALRVGSMTLSLSVPLFLSVSWMVVLLGRKQLLGHSALFIWMLTATVLQLFAEVLRAGLYARRQDNEYALVNILGVICSALTTVACIWLFGLSGAAYAMLLTGAFTLGCCFYFMINYPAKSGIMAQTHKIR